VDADAGRRVVSMGRLCAVIEAASASGKHPSYHRSYCVLPGRGCAVAPCGVEVSEVCGDDVGWVLVLSGADIM
jgi:hypothetical protein